MATIHSTIISGAGASSALLPLLAGKTSILLVTDKNVGALEATQAIHRLLAAEGREVEVIDSVPAEPNHHDVTQIVSQLGASQPQMVVGIGGGSVLDVAKLLSVLLHPEAPSLTALLAGEQPQRRICSLLIPATAGTGSEATPNAILAIPEQQTKVGIISPVLLPDYVALLPELTTSMPPSIAASTGIDALCHLLECFTSTVANPVSDNAALIGLHKLVRHIERSVNQPQDLTAKLEMLWASWYGGAAINYSGTHLVHALSYPLGGTWHLPHGVAALHAGGPPLRGGEVRSSLGPDPRCRSHAQRGREIPCAGRMAGGAGQTTAAAGQPGRARRASGEYFRPQRSGAKRQTPDEQCPMQRQPRRDRGHLPNAVSRTYLTGES